MPYLAESGGISNPKTLFIRQSKDEINRSINLDQVNIKHSSNRDKSLLVGYPSSCNGKQGILHTEKQTPVQRPLNDDHCYLLREL